MRVLEPSGDVVTLEDGEETRVQKRVHLYVGHRCDGTGMLLVTTRRVVWDPDCQARGLSGFSLFYPAIAMHAVCRDTSDFSQPCIYLQLDPEQNLGELAGVFEQEDASSKRARPESDDPSTEAANAAPMADDEEDSDGGEEEDDDVDQTWQELRLVPATEGGEGNVGANSTGTDAASVPDELDTIYAALCECAALNPDPDDGDDEGEAYFNSEEVLSSATAEQLSMLDRYDQLLADGDGRYDDAEEDELDEDLPSAQ